MASAAAKRRRRGATIRNGTSPSIKNIISAESFWDPGGRWWKHHAVQGGRHCVCYWTSSAVRCRQLGSPLVSLTTAEETNSLKSSALSAHSASREGAGSLDGRDHHRHGARNTASNPASSSNASHWNQQNSRVMPESER